MTEIKRRPKVSGLDLEAQQNLRRIFAEYQEKYNVTQEQFAEKLDISQSYFAQYLGGFSPISLKILVRLADALECNVSDIRTELKDKY